MQPSLWLLPSRPSRRSCLIDHRTDVREDSLTSGFSIPDVVQAVGERASTEGL